MTYLTIIVRENGKEVIGRKIAGGYINSIYIMDLDYAYKILGKYKHTDVPPKYMKEAGYNKMLEIEIFNNVNVSVLSVPLKGKIGLTDDKLDKILIGHRNCMQMGGEYLITIDNDINSDKIEINGVCLNTKDSNKKIFYHTA